jgi:hypothetical protein
MKNNQSWDCWGIYKGKGLAPKYPEPIRRRVMGSGLVQVQKQAVEGNEPRGGHWYICEGDMALFRNEEVEPWHGRDQVLCFRWLSPFLKVRPSSLLRLIHIQHAIPMPRPSHAANGLDRVFPILFTQYDRV